MTLSQRGIPILLISLCLTGVGGGLAVAGEDPATRLLELRLHTEQAIAQMRSEGDRALADEMERQLPGALAEVVDRLQAAAPEPLIADRLPERDAVAPRPQDLPAPKQDPVAERLAGLATFDGTPRYYDPAELQPMALTKEEKILDRYEHQVAMTEAHLDKMEAKFEQRWEILPTKFAEKQEKLADARGKLIEQIVAQREKTEEKLEKIEEKKDDQLTKAEAAPAPAPEPAPAPASDPKDRKQARDDRGKDQ